MDSTIMDDLMHELTAERQKLQGIRTNPEAPTMVAKVCRDGGELWLGPMPTEDPLSSFTFTPIHIQICCFKKLPTEVWVDESDDNSGGVFIPMQSSSSWR